MWAHARKATPGPHLSKTIMVLSKYYILFFSIIFIPQARKFVCNSVTHSGCPRTFAVWTSFLKSASDDFQKI